MPSDPCADGQTAPHLVDMGLIMTFVQNCGVSVDCVPSILGKGRRHSFCNQLQRTEFSFSSSVRIWLVIKGTYCLIPEYLEKLILCLPYGHDTWLGLIRWARHMGGENAACRTKITGLSLVHGYRGSCKEVAPKKEEPLLTSC